MAIQAQTLRLPLFLTPTPRLVERMFLGVGAPAMEALGECFIGLPASSPFVDRHDLEAMAGGGIDLHRVTTHDLGPLLGVDCNHGFGVSRTLDLGGEVGGDVFQ